MWEVEVEEVNSSLGLDFKEEIEWLEEESECALTAAAGFDSIKQEEKAAHKSPVDSSERHIHGIHPYIEVSVKIEQGAHDCEDKLGETESKSLQFSGDYNGPVGSHETLKARFHPKELLEFRNCFVRLERMHLYTSQFTCKICKTKLNSKHDLTSHMLCHTEDLPKLHMKAIKKLNSKRRLCHTCGKYFKTKQKSLKNTIDNDENPCTCKRIKTSQYVSIDRGEKILIEKPFECDDCGKCFKSKFLLRNHTRIHTGEKPYSCPICNKSFAELVNLTRHGLTHTGERPHCCNICNKHFAHKANLLAHVRIHTQDRPFACDVCGRDFVHSSDLKRHERTHLIDKPFPCDICEKQFTRRYHLADHLKTHIAKVKKNKENI